MAETKRKTIKKTNRLNKEIDGVAYIAHKSKFVKEAMKLYLRERKRLQTRDIMKCGYLEMSNINVNLSEVGFSEDISDFLLYEINLMGCEKF
jgi:CopG family transcriptional regulator / antitoxin EndoAI